MQANGSNHGSTSTKLRNSSSFGPNLPLQTDFNLIHQFNARNQVGILPDWRKNASTNSCRNLMRNQMSQVHYSQDRSSVIANALENELFIGASSQEEYMNSDTLIQRLDTQLKMLSGTTYSQHNSITYTPKKVLSSGLPQPAFQKVSTNQSPENCSSITTCTEMDVLPNFCVSAVGNNLEARPKSINYLFPQQHLDNCEVVPKKYVDCNGTVVQKNDSKEKSRQSEFSNSLSRSHVSRESSSISNIFTGLSSLGDIRQHQHQNWDFLQKLEHCKQAYVHAKTYMAQPNSCFVNQGEHCSQILEQITLNPEDFTADAFGFDESANRNPDGSYKVSDAQRILLHYFYYKNMDDGFSRPLALTYLHSATCAEGKCSCGRYKMLLLHFDVCQDVTCQICYSWKSLGTYIRELQFLKSSSLGSVIQRDNVSEHTLSPALKRRKRKMNSAFDVSSISNACLDGSTHKMVQVCSSEAFPKLQQHQETSLPTIHHKVSGCNLEQNSMLDSMSNSEIKNNVIDDTFENISKNKTNLSKDSEVDHISEEPDLRINDEKVKTNLEKTVIRKPRPKPEVVYTFEALMSSVHIKKPDPKSSDVKVSSNLEETVNSSNSIVHTLYNEHMHADTEETVPKSDHVKFISSLEETVIRLNSSVHTLNNEPMPPDDIEEPVSKCNHDNRNFEESTSEVNILCTELMPENVDGIQRRTYASVHTLHNEPMPLDIEEPVSKCNHDNSYFEESNSDVPADVDDIQGRTGFPQDGINDTKKIMESKADDEKETESSNPTVNTVSLTDIFTYNQIAEHIASLRNKFNQSTTVEEPGVDIYKCHLCEMGTLHFANSRGGNIRFNGTSVSKADLDKRTNNGESEEAWVECNKCKSWQHQICALYNNKRDLDHSAEYTCPICRLKEIENGMYVPLRKNAMFGAKDLARTMLSDHIERRLFKRLMQESEDWATVEGNKNFDEVLLSENLSVRVVLSVEKQLKVKKQFLDIFGEENYPAVFSYTSKVILLFQQIEGVDVCLFSMYVQEFGSECGNPNQRCVYISYLDSVKYFRPQRRTMSGEALRTFVYHEILIGYLDFCKKRGFTTCYIWACPPMKGEDYILYCHPDSQKTPKNDKLRHWYLSMLRKAAEENIVVGLTNIYDNFFVSSGNCDTKVTASRLPYFDGDFWCGAAMDKARIIEQESGGDYEKLKKLITKRTLKAMGQVNPSKENAKDILVMQRLGQTILPFKEDFIIAQLQYACMHCREVIVSGKRWFCTATECNKFQECERCHTTDSHTSLNGAKHTLFQILMDDILCDTKENDVIFDNGLFDTRHNFLSYCQRNSLQFDSLRRAKYSSMMILYLLKNPTLLNVGTICSLCSKQNVYQCCWKCENCPEFTVCSACYNKEGANCHAHTLNETYSTALCPSGNQELNQNSALIQELQHIIEHASRCRSTKAQPCTYPHCLQIKKLFSHASRCTIRVSGGCKYCKKVWLALAVHSRNCRDSGCRIPRCMDLKMQEEWIATQSESRRRAAVLECESELSPHC
ncbi:hypothetical protein Fmac_016514 [Flemingia macrophylla]|uniref:histone acetyltransferase n=1 Tax=Flemingia macrophylla TaxID=520843 RepID=A0ABD1MHP0_9FABA